MEREMSTDNTYWLIAVLLWIFFILLVLLR